MLSLPLILFVLAAGLLIVFWQNSLGVRERANHAAQDACARMQLQFLDGTVAFARMTLARDAGRLTLRRTYVFDYTAGSIDRKQGFVTLLGQRVETIGFAPGTTDSQFLAGAAHDAAPPESPSTHSHKVINLEDFRQRRKPGEPGTGAHPPPGNSSDRGW